MKWLSLLVFFIGLLPHGSLIAQGNVGIGTIIPDAVPYWILTSDSKAAEQQASIAFSAHNVGNQWIEILNTNDVLVPFQQENYDLGNNFLTAGSLVMPNTFLAPKSGIYHFEASITWADWENNPVSGASLSFKVNGATFHSVSGFPGQIGHEFIMPLSIDVSLQAGDQVRLFASQCSTYHSTYQL